MTENHQTIFIVDDDSEIVHALRWLFESVKFKVETFSSANAFLEAYKTPKLGCLIVDVRLPGMSGLELLEYLQAKKIKLPVIIMTGYGDIQMAVRAMKSGARDFILKPFNNQWLLETVQKCISLSLQTNSNDLVKSCIEKLSNREKQIMDLILNGKLNKEIAYELSLSISTVEAHRASIMNKMEAKTVAQLIKLYLQVQFSESIA